VSALFGRCVAWQCAELLGELGGGDVLELGAGSGALAADLLGELGRLGSSPRRYLILDLSPELRARQAETLAARVHDRLDCVEWLDELPPPGSFRGVVIGNEVADALPVHRFRIAGGSVLEGAVAVCGEGLAERWIPPVSPGLTEAVARIEERVGGLPEGYASEVSLRLGPWVAAIAGTLQAGALLLVDYGYTRREYYHPDRNGGTLLCHYRHRVHGDPLRLPGLQDITASVDFSALAEAGAAAGLSLAGYATQASFLLANGLDRLLGESDPTDTARHLALVQGAKLLTLPGEMGERFKVIGLDKGLERPWSGFALRDLAGRL
jgi:SAM-dependent MidA family methyltransferase